MLALVPCVSYGVSKTSIRFGLDNSQDTVLVIGKHSHGKIYVADSLYCDAGGAFLWEVDSLIPQGFYEVLLDQERRLTLLVAQDRQFEVKIGNNTSHEASIEGAMESAAYLQYQQYIAGLSKERQALSSRFSSSMQQADSLALYKSLQNALDDSVKFYMAALKEKYEGAFLAKVLSASMPVSYPDYSQEDTQRANELRYEYFINHYFDNIALDDERLLRTPIYYERLNYYYQKILPPLPDTLVSKSLSIINKAATNKETFRYTLNYIMRYSEQSKVMGMDALTLALLQSYYLNGKVDWLDTETKKKAQERAALLRYNQLGAIAKDISFPLWNNQENKQSIADLQKETKVLIFYEPDCGHCKQEMPDLHQTLFKDDKYANVDVVAICAMADTLLHNKFIRKHALYSWINLCDDGSNPYYRMYYNLINVPKIYVLDKDNRIIAKDIDEENLIKILDKRGFESLSHRM